MKVKNMVISLMTRWIGLWVFVGNAVRGIELTPKVTTTAPGSLNNVGSNYFCQFDVTVDFWMQPISVKTIDPIPGLDRMANNNNNPYSFTYTLSNNELWPKSFTIKIQKEVACLELDPATNNCTDRNLESIAYPVTIDCGAQTRENCWWEVGTVFDPATKSCKKIDATNGMWWTLTCPKEWETPVTINGSQTCVCDPSYIDLKTGKYQCCGIKLLTSVPFIGKCIYMISDADKQALWAKATANPDALTISEDTAFPRLMLWLTKILVTVILLASFIAIIVAGVMMAASGTGEEWYSKWKTIIGSVIAALALLGASGVILRLINPNFFG